MGAWSFAVSETVERLEKPSYVEVVRITATEKPIGWDEVSPGVYVCFPHRVLDTFTPPSGTASIHFGIRTHHKLPPREVGVYGDVCMVKTRLTNVRAMVNVGNLTYSDPVYLSRPLPETIPLSPILDTAENPAVWELVKADDTVCIRDACATFSGGQPGHTLFGIDQWRIRTEASAVTAQTIEFHCSIKINLKTLRIRIQALGTENHRIARTG